MTDGRADHTTPPHAMQLRSMLRVGGAKGNGKRGDLLDTFPGQGRGHVLTAWGCRQHQTVAREPIVANPGRDSARDEVGLPVMGDGTFRFVHRESSKIGKVAVKGGLRFLWGAASIKRLTALPRELLGNVTR